jgi:hypothetical protein
VAGLIAAHPSIYIDFQNRYGMYLLPPVYIFFISFLFGLSNINLPSKEISKSIVFLCVPISCYNIPRLKDYYYSHIHSDYKEYIKDYRIPYAGFLRPFDEHITTGQFYQYTMNTANMFKYYNVKNYIITELYEMVRIK